MASGGESVQYTGSPAPLQTAVVVVGVVVVVVGAGHVPQSTGHSARMTGANVLLLDATHWAASMVAQLAESAFPLHVSTVVVIVVAVVDVTVGVVIGHE